VHAQCVLIRLRCNDDHDTANDDEQQTKLLRGADGKFIRTQGRGNGTQPVDEKKVKQLMAQYVISAELPFKGIENEEFNRLCHYLNTSFKPISRKVVKTAVFKEFKCLEAMIKFKLQENGKGKIASTTDMWTSNQSKGYMVLTCHFIDAEWNLYAFPVEFKQIMYPHTAEVLKKVYCEGMGKWQIYPEEISACTLDNASNNVSFMDKISSEMYYPNLCHVRCVAHVLHLIAKESLDIQQDFIGTIRVFINKLFNAPSTKEAFQAHLRITSPHLLECKEPALDTQTRWNSTFEMLEAAMPFREAFDRYAGVVELAIINTLEWEVARMLLQILKPLRDMTLTLCETMNPTIHLVFPLISDLEGKLQATLSGLCESLNEEQQRNSTLVVF